MRDIGITEADLENIPEPAPQVQPPQPPPPPPPEQPRYERVVPATMPDAIANIQSSRDETDVYVCRCPGCHLWFAPREVKHRRLGERRLLRCSGCAWRFHNNQ